MRSEDETASELRSWLKDGATEMPDRILDDVLEQLGTRRQRRVLWPARPFLRIQQGLRPVALATAVVVAVVLGVLLPGLGLVGTPWERPAIRSIETPVGPLPEGRYHIDVPLHNFVSDGVVGQRTKGGWARMAFDLPDGWDGLGWAVVKTQGGAIEMSLAAYTITRIYRDPCHNATGLLSDLADPQLLRTAEGLARALSVSWREPRFAPTSPSATEPLTTTFAGMPAWYVEVTAATGLDFATCDNGKYLMWLDGGGGERYLQGPDQLERLWVVDVGARATDIAVPGGGRRRSGNDEGPSSGLPGGLVVFEASSLPRASQQDLGELDAIIDSITVEFMEAP